MCSAIRRQTVPTVSTRTGSTDCAAASTSAASTAPSGPEPDTVPRSSPRSEANLRALGEAKTFVDATAAMVRGIGGGITGAGVARDAALRGLAVALVERTDWAAGTSSRSSKLIHGGVRYLELGDVGLVRESATERA